jgi:hypothetical protein
MTFRKLPRLPYPGRTLEFRKEELDEESAKEAGAEATTKKDDGR